MNKNQLANQYKDSVSSNINSITITDPGASSIYYPNSTTGGNTISFAYTTATCSNVINPAIDKTMNAMPLILKVKNVSVDGNKIEILFDKFSHRNWDKFLPDLGIVYFGEEIYGVYNKRDYLYWENAIKVRVEDVDAALKVIKEGTLFITINNWDERITNQEASLFLNDTKAYKRYAHLLLETFLDEEKEPRNLKRRTEIHSGLEK